MAVPIKHSGLKELLADGERVLWTGKPDTLVTFKTQTFWWFIGVPWLAATLAAYFYGLIGEAFYPLVLFACALLAAPFLMVALSYGTDYVITDRRAIIHSDALGRKQTISVDFADMEEKLEILPNGNDGGAHLYFASGYSTKLSFADYTGKLAFRDVKNAEAIAATLERAREEWKKRKQ